MFVLRHTIQTRFSVQKSIINTAPSHIPPFQQKSEFKCSTCLNSLNMKIPVSFEVSFHWSHFWCPLKIVSSLHFLSFHPFCHFRSCEYRVGKSTRCLVLIRFGVINYVLVARRKNIFFTILYCIFALCRLKVWKIWLLFAEHFTIKKTNTHDTHALYTIVSTGKLLKTVPQTHNHWIYIFIIICNDLHPLTLWISIISLYQRQQLSWK